MVAVFDLIFYKSVEIIPHFTVHHGIFRMDNFKVSYLIYRRRFSSSSFCNMGSTRSDLLRQSNVKGINAPAMVMPPATRKGTTYEPSLSANNPGKGENESIKLSFDR